MPLRMRRVSSPTVKEGCLNNAPVNAGYTISRQPLLMRAPTDASHTHLKSGDAVFDWNG